MDTLPFCPSLPVLSSTERHRPTYYTAIVELRALKAETEKPYDEHIKKPTKNSASFLPPNPNNAAHPCYAGITSALIDASLKRLYNPITYSKTKA